jgi:outer membrane protein insertion porin family/translocation and assembly module TamA
LIDVRIRPQLAGYVPLDKKHKLVLASRVGLGYVFPQNYGDALINSHGNLDYTDKDVIADQHKLLFRAFYSGGPSSNRGYPYQRVGPQGAIGFLLPEGETCDGPDPPATCVRPLGGFTLWETSLELRYRAFESWSFVAFVDASDVSSKLHHISLTEPHVSVGPGVRYLSPVGPIRVDLGFRIPGLQKLKDVAANSDEPPDVSEVAPYNDQTWQNWGRSLALQILIGEAF